jgi:serine/threonine-protein kinase
VAIKVVAEILALSTQARLRFEREIKATRAIEHPNVVRLLGHGALEDGRPFLVMELVSGQSLAAYLEERAELLGAYSAVVVGCQILDGLEAAHREGIIHRDLKPANVLLAERADGRGRRVKIVDFGVALVLDLAESPEQRLTRTGTLLGSPRYMPAELARGGAADARTDVFGAAATLYHALTGHAPFVGANIGAVMAKIIRHEIPPLAEERPDLPRELCACLERALAHEPGDRFVGAAEMRASLAALYSTSRTRSADSTRPKGGIT